MVLRGSARRLDWVREPNVHEIGDRSIGKDMAMDGASDD
jgi:hypothetical protein